MGGDHPGKDELDAKRAAPYSRYQEREADAFASEHNTPTAWVQPYCDAAGGSFAVVRAIANTFRSSLVASALRYVELSSAPCAVAYTECGEVKWAKHSATFPARIPRQLKLSSETVAFGCSTTTVAAAVARVVPARAWLGMPASVTQQINIVEDAERIPEPGWGGVLSLLVATPAVQLAA